MIDKNFVQQVVEEWLQSRDYFLVDIQIEAGDRIVVEIDHAEGVWIDDCVDLSRFIEARLNRDEEDYELEVGSAGVGQPFKVKLQYEAHVGREVEVLTAEGRKEHGVLTEVTDEDFVLQVQEKQRLEGTKRPKLVEVEHRHRFDGIKWAKAVINFK